MRYKLLIGAIISLITAYSGYWYVIAGKIRAATDNFTTDMARDGIDLEFSAKSVSGYPYRLILDYENPSMAGPGWSWRAPKFEAFAQPYDLTRYIISAPGPHTIELTPPGGFPTRLSLEAESARASLDYSSQSQLNQVDIDLQSVKYNNVNAEISLQAGRLQAHIRPTPEQIAPALDIAFKSEDLVLPDQIITSVLGNEIKLIQLTTRLHGTDIIETLSILPVLLQSGRGFRLEITDAGLIWGTLTITAKGELTLDDFNRPEGEIQLAVSGHEEVLKRLEEAGFLEPGIAGTARATLGALAAMNNGKALITITLRDGKASAGLLRLGDLAPLF